jgi:FkbM family methyltransferase
MDLAFNPDPLFTRWIVAEGLLREDFVVVDVGVLGGENPRWHLLGDHLAVYGFDAFKEAVDALAAEPGRSSRYRYRWCAIGDEDGERDFFVVPHDPTQSSFYQPGDSRHADGRPSYEARRVPVRSLDSLLAAGEIEAPDFLKVDVEGFEKYVFLGASRCLSERLLAIETETNFNASPPYPDTHFGFLQQCVLPHGFLLSDLNFDRPPRATFGNALRARGLPQLPEQQVSRPGTVNVLFCRDLIAEAGGVQFGMPQRAPRSADEIIKAMIICELHRLNDVAFDISSRFSAELASRLDVEKAGSLLLESGRAGERLSVAELQQQIGELTAMKADLQRKVDDLQRKVDDLAQTGAELRGLIAELKGSTSWKVTTPMRWLKDRFVR